MKCAWRLFLKLLPQWMRDQVDRHGRETLQELRLRLNSPPELVRNSGVIRLDRNVSSDDLKYCINAASAYSPWTATTVTNGFITAPGGHRIGLCGEVIIADGQVTGVRTVTSLCIRIAREYQNIADKTVDTYGSVLIIGCPGSGKTTFLRDMIRVHSDNGQAISVIDERQELFPLPTDGVLFSPGSRTDILSGCPKQDGISMVLRSMCPDIIAVDEITAQGDCDALIHAGWCGVRLFATAHAANRDELFQRPVYKPIVQSNLFDHLIVLNRDKRWRIERMSK